MVNNNRWKQTKPNPTATRKRAAAGRYATDKACDYKPYFTALRVVDEKHQSFYDKVKHYVGDTDSRFKKLMRGDNESLTTLSRGFLEKCGREIWASEPSPWKHDRMYGRNWVAEHWLKDQEVLVTGLVALFVHMRDILWDFAIPPHKEGHDITFMKHSAKKKRGGKIQAPYSSYSSILNRQVGDRETTAWTVSTSTCAKAKVGRTIEEIFDTRVKKSQKQFH